ncbi:ABC transporter permease [Aeromicrobium sp. SMF47]|uniref:Xylose transport system permease protein XylH n=1 Tax=Aeromicrobium yanjiei TaxID=2662028 RepID=A0A5Q2MMP2_9ACTN|nr:MULTISPECIES: ABC transporter permease [Aeromicrobium]MRJ77681.1 ABC transporter permease [Aeromicrobium yanjiei]MRK02050.1 ABC transporter permease [Aeromicrobium sp. S22]QGG41220.1 ABC transporter permease [Aeromicrobium yanjiei]
MTDIISDAEEAGFANDRTQSNTLGEAARAYVNRVRGGDMGALPAILGLIVLFIVFGFANDRFFSALNMANLITQAGAIIVLAMGLVLVLLLGDIDLSAGVTGGVSACVMGLLIAKHDQPWGVAVLLALVTGAVIGLVIGVLVAKLGIPSFVVTLAFFLGLQGVTLKLIGDGGSVRVDQEVIKGITKSNVPVVWGWVLAIVIIVAFAALSLRSHRAKVTKGLQHQPLAVVVAQIVALAVIVLVVTAVLNVNRAPNPGFTIEGVPYVLLLVAALLIFWTFVLSRTSYGRHVYAVGGNAEAARRAGISVDRIRISVFVFSSSMAALSGIIAASNLGKVSTSSGGSNTLLYAVGAAVIGGTSLFGGKGKARDAVIGGLVIATIANGLGLLDQASYINFIVTGGVLLLAASVDAISRRRRSATGL